VKLAADNFVRWTLTELENKLNDYPKLKIEKQITTWKEIT